MHGTRVTPTRAPTLVGLRDRARSQSGHDGSTNAKSTNTTASVPAAFIAIAEREIGGPLPATLRSGLQLGSTAEVRRHGRWWWRRPDGVDSLLATPV